MGTGIFSIGVSGIAAAQMGLLTTEHNVVNANTPGYSRQTTTQATNIAVNTGAGAMGQGVHVQTVKRMYDSYVNSQVNTAQTQVSQLDSFYSEISQIDNLLADPNAGLSPALQSFFAGVQQVASNPSLLPARQSMISSAQTLVGRFQDIQSKIGEIADEVNGRITDAVSEINAYAAQIADVNQRIVVAEAAYQQPANDLLDQRDQLVSELNKRIRVQTSTNSNGSYNVYIGNGQQLVVGSQVMQLTATASTSDPSKIVVGLKTNSGTLQMPDSLIVGGQLGGLVDFRNRSLDSVGNELGRIAASVALTFNAQHELGQDLQGNILGNAGFVGNFFSIPSPMVLPNAGNTGTGAVSASLAAPSNSGNFYTNLTNSNYQVAFGAAGAYTITRQSDGQLVGSGSGAGSVTVDGVAITIGAVGNNGDTFVIKPVADAAMTISVDGRIAADPRLVAAAAPVRTAPVQTNTGSMTISQGSVATGYSMAGLPVTLSATATTLNGVPGTWTAVYSDGTSSAPSSGNIPLTAGAATLAKITFNGMSFDIKGSPAAGDQFTVQQNTAGVQDGRNAVLFAKLQTQNTVSGGTATYQAAFARLVADNGIMTRETKVKMDAQTSVLKQAQSAREALSGVNLDEEAAEMLKFQRAYQASSKILEVGNQLFDTILSLGR
ncbi:MAG: flagellar hook-associated protein FlgK [Dechloromonas sp.]|uniref:flagellar hook-associated protein FlgK n=1 Tax=Dechloromonas sp. CZR5 TaxID=2608630 RepID=UPI00168A7C56|nr:flagellar hook-associated protein FlgK [Dechloromonas sp. CZR5]MBL8405566.1 flagellar hook-associated protein FlgK [Dechloromonas sp.]